MPCVAAWVHPEIIDKFASSWKKKFVDFWNHEIKQDLESLEIIIIIVFIRRKAFAMTNFEGLWHSIFDWMFTLNIAQTLKYKIPPLEQL